MIDADDGHDTPPFQAPQVMKCEGIAPDGTTASSRRIAELEADNSRLRYELETVRLWAKGHYMQVSDLVTGAMAQQQSDEGK